MDNTQKAVRLVLNVTLAMLVGITTLAYACNANAGTLDSEFTNDDGDTICVYDSHFHKVYVNVGTTGICHLTNED